MATIDIKKGYKHISPEELRSYVYSGHVYCGTTDMSDFLEYIFQDMVSQDELDKAVEEALKESKYAASYSICSECESEIY